MNRPSWGPGMRKTKQNKPAHVTGYGSQKNAIKTAKLHQELSKDKPDEPNPFGIVMLNNNLVFCWTQNTHEENIKKIFDVHIETESQDRFFKEAIKLIENITNISQQTKLELEKIKGSRLNEEDNHSWVEAQMKHPCCIHTFTPVVKALFIINQMKQES